MRCFTSSRSNGMCRRGTCCDRLIGSSNSTDGGGPAVGEYSAHLVHAAFGSATEVTPQFIGPADPAARWTAVHRGPAFFAYSANYLIDVDNAIIVMSKRRQRSGKPR